MEAQKDICEIGTSKMARVLAAETAIAARAAVPSVSTALVAAARERAERASTAAADATLAELKTAAEQEVTDLTTGGHLVARAISASRAEVEATFEGRRDTDLRERIVANAKVTQTQVVLRSRSTSVFDSKLFPLVTDFCVLLTHAAFGPDVAKCLAAKFEVAASGVTKSKESVMLLCTPHAIDAARTTASTLRQVEASEETRRKAAKGSKSEKGDKSDKRPGKPASAPPRPSAPAPAPAPPPAAPAPAPARRAAGTGAGSRRRQPSVPRLRRDRSPDSDGHRRSWSRP